jgi:hypothetical protein
MKLIILTKSDYGGQGEKLPFPYQEDLYLEKRGFPSISYSRILKQDNFIYNCAARRGKWKF